MKLRPHGKNGVTGTEGILTMIICVLMIELLNTKIPVLVFTGITSAFLVKSCHSDWKTHRVHCTGTERVLSEETVDLQM
jgi:high-affinity Fe2+/Pb2+ permease